jgi:4-hydroxy-3-polyprenylbenzoate decarboxylase
MPLVLAITGASGAVYAVRLLEVLLQQKREVHLTVSTSGVAVLGQELGVELDLEQFRLTDLLPSKLLRSSLDVADAEVEQLVSYHHYKDFMAPIASGSFLTSGMVICPCSGSTLSGFVNAASGNLIQRAADVHLKEQRKLILVPRETPLSVLQIQNMHRAAKAGAVVLPAAPGWYHGVKSLDDLIDFVVARILDQLGIPHSLMRRWGEDSGRDADGPQGNTR